MPQLPRLLAVRLLRRLAGWRRWLLRAVQLAVFLVAGVSAFLLRFDLGIPRLWRGDLLVALCVWAVVKVIVFHSLGLDRGWWRYTSVPDFLRLIAANSLGSAISCVVMVLFWPHETLPSFPRSLYPLDFLLCLLMTAGIRLSVRVGYEVTRPRSAIQKKRTLIYGAGDAGVSLLREIRQNPALAYDLVGFVDDSPGKASHSIQRMPILGNGAALPSFAKAYDIEMVLIALPSATGAEMTAILKRCQEAGVAYKTVPGLAEMIESGGLASQIRDVAVEDLLGRSPVHLDESGIRAKIENKVVAVTGAAGSIGSELCRQIARFHPAAIIGYECAETPLFYIEREMLASFPETSFIPEIGDIRNPRRLAEVLGKHRPAVLYHAAAYKHVPMMESHVFEAVENNVIGTWNVATIAAECGVNDFVMISSDKAVRPANVMGATKRVAELLIHALQNGRTKYVSVRFGNVLGSNGSVIPLFKQQIAARKPVTVTHPEMRRYFMTIPEAAQLVIQASAMGKGGEIFVLDMGQPVRIVDLARNLILLSGLQPDKDIPIEFSGVRPGEKLSEELAHQDEETLATFHQKIRILAGSGLPEHGMSERVERFRQLCAARDLPAIILELKDLIPEYNPSTHLLRQVMTHEETRPAKSRATAAGE